MVILDIYRKKFRKFSQPGITPVINRLPKTETMEIRLPKNRKNDYSRETIKIRIKKLSGINGHNLKYLESSVINPSLAKGNIENIIGFSQVPVGIMGPIAINGNHARGDFFVPLSTTEGALVASYNRGARAISLSGGANVVIYRDQIQRAPLFVLENVFKTIEFIEWFIHKTKDFHRLLQDFRNIKKRPTQSILKKCLRYRPTL